MNSAGLFTAASACGYRYAEKVRIAPLFPFGFGLSYTRFEMGSLILDLAEVAPGGTLVASLSVSNVGARHGSTVVQLYVADEKASVSRPEEELKGFKKGCPRARRDEDRDADPRHASARVFRRLAQGLGRGSRIVHAIRRFLERRGRLAGGAACYELKRLAADGFDENGEIVVPDCVRVALRPLVGQIDLLDEAIAAIDKELAASVKADETAKRLTTIPGVGPVTASAIAATTQDTRTFASGREFV